MEIVKKHIHTFSLGTLDKVELNSLINKARYGCLDSRNKVVSHNMKLVMNIASRYYYCYNSVFTYEDLFQVGCIGLIRAIKTFDTSLNLAFSTYAVLWIKQHVRRYIDDNTGPVRLPVYIKEIQRRYKKLREVDDSKTDDFYIKLVAFEKNLSVETVRKCLGLKMLGVSSDNVDVHFKLEEEFYDTINLDDFNFSEMFHFLNDREIFILKKRLENYTLTAIGTEMGISRERVRQLADSSFRKLRAVYNADVVNNL